ncbi:MAG: DsbA family protein, partial [Myxococcales bacterium]|nr:DsbA family protein [Myxococcales bacterium]
GDAPGKGPADAPVIVVEFSDLQCPHCKNVAASLSAVQKALPQTLRYHFKHFPMDPACNRIVEGSGHPQACGAHVAVVCAERMGKAWQMHDLIFENQHDLGRDALMGFAGRIGVDVEAFGACLDDPSALEVVKADIEQGIKLGVPGTPVWFANGWREVGARDAATLQAIIEMRAKQGAAQ